MSTAVGLSRATTLEEFEEKLGRMIVMDDVIQALSFEPRPTDIIITPFAKCGTTWLQQIVHTLRTRGDTDYDDISAVVPWIETSVALGVDLNAPQRGEPRAYKSHLAWDLVPKGGRYIVAIRDPKDALVSMYRFMEGWFFEPGSVTIDQMARGRFMRRSDPQHYWHHLISWWEQRHNDAVLMLSYEEMKRDAETAIRRVASFVNIELDADMLALTLCNSSLDYMLEHKDQFDDRMMRERSEQVCDLPPGGDSAKVRKGLVGEHREALPDDVAGEMDAIWAEEIETRLGFADYQALEAALVRGR